jgi:DNA-binding transcriptional MerR regulator
MTKTLTVGQAARASGLTAKAVRLYEQRGLIPPVQRTEAGYRLYDDADVATLRFIRRAKALGLSLAEIGDVVALRRGGERPCQHVLRLLDHHTAEIDRTIAELQLLRQTLVETRAAAATAATDGDSAVCRLIEHRPEGRSEHRVTEVELGT